MAETPRGKILETALNLTEGDRNKTYGSPRTNLQILASLINAYTNGRPELNEVDMAIVMCLTKISRIAVNQNHEDNYVDLAAYAAIAGELAVPEPVYSKGATPNSDAYKPMISVPHLAGDKNEVY